MGTQRLSSGKLSAGAAAFVPRTDSGTLLTQLSGGLAASIGGDGGAQKRVDSSAAAAVGASGVQPATPVGALRLAGEGSTVVSRLAGMDLQTSPSDALYLSPAGSFGMHARPPPCPPLSPAPQDFKICRSREHDLDVRASLSVPCTAVVLGCAWAEITMAWGDISGVPTVWTQLHRNSAKPIRMVLCWRSPTLPL